jgi:hypothetical protein
MSYIYDISHLRVNMREATSSSFIPHEPKTLSECPYHTSVLINIPVNCEVVAGTLVAGWSPLWFPPAT